MNGALLTVIAVTVIPAFLVSWIAVGWIARHARRLGLLDRPNARKVHTNPTPLGGGIGIWLGVVTVFAAGTVATLLISKNPAWGAVWLPESMTVYLPGLVSRIGSIWFLIVAGSVLMVLGLLDDRYGLDWRLRLAIELGVASAVVYGQHLQLTAYINAPWLTSILSVFWIVMLINAFNMLDNMDALSGGVASIICAMLSIMLVTTPESEIGQPQWFVAAMMLTLLGSLLGFLKHNRPPAKIFMGDAGSYFVGYWIAIGTLLSTYPGARGDTPHAVLAPLCLLAIPLYDMVSVIWIRVREGRSPFQADKKHFSHRLVELGMTKTQAVATILLATLTCSLGALILPRTDLVGAGIVIAIVVAMLALIAVLESLTSGSDR